MAPVQPTFNPKQYLQLYLDEKYDELSDAFIGVLTHFEGILYTETNPELQYFVDVFMKNFLYLFSQPDYILSDQHALRFIQLNPVIANLTAISHQGTTDPCLEILQKQPQNFIKILTLLNARCKIQVDYPQLLSTNAALATQWYSYYLELYSSAQVNPTARKNLRHHITYTDDDRLVEFANITEVYLGATYLNHEGDRPLKERLNQAIQNNAFCKTAGIQNPQPNPKKIAIIGSLSPNNPSLHRTTLKFIEALNEDYELTLLHTGKDSDSIETSLFKDVIPLKVEDGVLDISPIRHNDFGIVCFPEIGTTPKSILLANLRIAPIQIAGLGHPMSTFGAAIDYIFSGENTEVSRSGKKNYGERLVLLPGNGVIHSKPDYQLQNIKKNRSEVVVNCPWLAQKVNEPLVKLLGYIQKKTQKKAFFRFFTGNSLRKNALLPFIQDLEQVLGEESFEVILGKPYDDYLALMEAGDLSLDSYPFGGSSAMVDSLYLRKPTVSYEGKKWVNRIGSQLLRQAGLSELIATNANDYAQLAIKLIDNTAYRQGVSDRIKKVDLDKALFDTQDKQYFKKAIAYLWDNHETLSQEDSTEPIVISQLP